MVTMKPQSDIPALRVLVVDDEPFFLRLWKEILKDHPCETQSLSSARDALSAIDAWDPDVAVLDIVMPNMTGMQLLREIKARGLTTEVVIMTGHASVSTAVEAVKTGAFDYLTKPFEDFEAAALAVMKAGRYRHLLKRNRQLENLLEKTGHFEGMVGTSPQMSRVFDLLESISQSESSVLIQGESGTGKELVARAIHKRSPRNSKTFLAKNCSALTDTLLESELFGHEKGAFTGATQTKRGLFEVADGGTLLLDEVVQIPLSTQAKLLRVLQEGELRRVGDNQIRRVDVRVLAATNADIEKEVSNSAFREDLYYRLNVIRVQLPALRERSGDISLLAQHFVQKHCFRNGKRIEGISPQAMNMLERYDWPGNVREMENVIERAVVLNREGEIVPSDLPDTLGRANSGGGNGHRSALLDLPYSEAREIARTEFDQDYISGLLRLTEGNITQAARKAGMDRSNFRRVVRRIQIDPATYSGNGGGR